MPVTSPKKVEEHRLTLNLPSDMQRPSLVRRMKLWFWGGVIIFALFVICLAVVNLVDAFPFWRAMRRVRQLDPNSARAIAEACTRYEKGGHQRLLEGDIPSEFLSLKPVRVSFYPGSSDIALFEPNDFQYVFLRVSTDSKNQTVVCVSAGLDGQRSHVLWERNPEFTRQVNPIGRIVTVTQSAMSEARSWIVRESELLVIDRSGAISHPAQITAVVPLSLTQRETIESAMRSIGPEIRGHVFDSGSLDGLHLSISFTNDGNQGEEDIVFMNAWRDEIGPLIAAITNVAGKENVIEFPESIRRQRASFADGANSLDRVRTLAENKRRREYAPRPWWCCWPQLGWVKH